MRVYSSLSTDLRYLGLIAVHGRATEATPTAVVVLYKYQSSYSILVLYCLTNECLLTMAKEFLQLYLRYLLKQYYYCTT